MSSKGGVISFRVGEEELSELRRRAKHLPRKANGRQASSNEVAHLLVREGLHRTPSSQGMDLAEVVRAMGATLPARKPSVPVPVKVALPDGETPAAFLLKHRARK
jgi:hypothetical protein